MNKNSDISFGTELPHSACFSVLSILSFFKILSFIKTELKFHFI